MEAAVAAVAIKPAAALGPAPVVAREMPALGSGLAFRQPHLADLFSRPESVDFLEITLDHYLEATTEQQDELDLLARRFRLTLHTLDLSPGSAEGIDDRYLRRAAALVERLQPAWWSDHIAFTRAGGVNIGHLTPLPLNQEALDVTCRAVRAARQATGVPLLMENITRGFRLPGDEMTEPEFLSRLVDRTGCGLLIDVTNLLINSLNEGGDPLEWMEGIPVEAVVELHYSGGHQQEGQEVDSHAHPTPEPVWDLMNEVLARCPVRATVLERDERIPPLAELQPELDRARELGREAGRWS